MIHYGEKLIRCLEIFHNHHIDIRCVMNKTARYFQQKLPKHKDGIDQEERST